MTFFFSRAQRGWKSRDQRPKHEDHCDYTYLTDIPSSISLDEVNDAFDLFCDIINSKAMKKYKCTSDFTEIQLHRDPKTAFWTFKFRYDLYLLDDEYEIDTDTAEEDTLDDTANNTQSSDGNAVYSALVAGSNNDFI